MELKIQRYNQICVTMAQSKLRHKIGAHRFSPLTLHWTVKPLNSYNNFSSKHNEIINTEIELWFSETGVKFNWRFDISTRFDSLHINVFMSKTSSIVDGGSRLIQILWCTLVFLCCENSKTFRFRASLTFSTKNKVDKIKTEGFLETKPASKEHLDKI